MTTNRLSKNKTKLNNIQSFIAQTDQVIIEIYHIFSDFFSQKRHPSEINETLFEHLWIKMNVKDVTFSSLTELDLYYNDLIKNIDFFIKHFYVANPEQKIIEKINKTSIAPVISINYAMAKYNFILQKLNESYHAFKTKINIKNIEFLNANSSIDFAQLEKYYDEIDAFTDHLSSIISSKQGLNSAIDDLKKSVQENDKQNIKKFTDLLNDYVKIINEAKNNLPNFFIYNDFLDKIAAERNLLKKQIDNFNKALQFFQVLKNMVEWLDKKEIKKAFDCTVFTHNPSSDISFLELLSSNAESQKRKLMRAYHQLFLEKCHAGLTKKYNQFSTYIHPYSQSFTELCHRFEAIDRNHFMLYSKLQNIRQLWTESEEVIESIEEALNEQKSLMQKNIPENNSYSMFGDLRNMLFDMASSTLSFWQQAPAKTNGKEENVEFKKNGYNG